VVAAIAGLIAPEAANRPPTVPFVFAAMAIPALALLGAGLAPAAVGSRAEAAIVGVAFAIGAPVAAAMSTAIAVLVLMATSDNSDQTAFAVGGVIRLGVIAAVRVSPLLALAALLWVVTLRVLERRRTA
jgi:hypothetical protein